MTQYTNSNRVENTKYIEQECPTCGESYKFELRYKNGNPEYFRNNERVENGEIMQCNSCQGSLEIFIKGEVLRLEEAPEEDEDWFFI